MSRTSEPPSLGDFKGHEIYPMPIFAKVAVQNVGDVAKWYRDALGFDTIFDMPGPDGQLMLSHLRRKKYQDVLVVAARSPQTAGTGMTLNFSADDEVDALAQRAKSTPPVGASSVSDPINTPWNTRDLNVVDPAGN